MEVLFWICLFNFNDVPNKFLVLNQFKNPRHLVNASDNDILSLETPIYRSYKATYACVEITRFNAVTANIRYDIRFNTLTKPIIISTYALD